ncbi:proteasome activator complex subunit 3-like [Styela clava]|uniref:proteasome activator complex subunit 3-like n=1 Tax=Styela clava TaxID=7725 RepID=UPI001939BC0F|nr:proteasome activator complex subunit 3-like [Styela clava]
MEDFKDRLRRETESLFKTIFPSKCEKFHKLVYDPMLGPDAMLAINITVNESCKALREEIKQREEESKKIKDRFYTPAQSDSELDDSSERCRKLKRKLKQDRDDDEEKEDIDLSNMECNKHISKIIDVLKPEVRELIESCNTVKTWVQLQIPEIQDGNNFGVEVQEEILEEVRKVEDDCNTFLKTISVYHLTRAEMVSKFIKFPSVDDYVCSLEQLDAKEFVTLRLIALELRNYCLGLLDLFEKNMEKILTPRGINNVHMLVY